MIEPKIVMEDTLLLVGLSFFGDPFDNSSTWSEENAIGTLWKRLMKLIHGKRDFVKHVRENDVFHEVHIETEETAEKGQYEVFVGIAVEKLEDVPIHFVVKQIPASTYMVFALKGQEIVGDWEKDVFSRMPSLGYEQAHGFNIQYYDSRFKGLDKIDSSEIDVYIPVRKIIG
ncbi:MAG: hypothetical protein GY816_09915 [Cytophagales bacterium]|nr:hypothetical protein [Cytophagales bacterium]